MARSSSATDPAPVFWRELLARWGLCALVLAPFVVYAPRVLFPATSSGPAGPLGRSAPGAPAPTWMHLLVVTTGDVPSAAGARLANVRAWRERSSHARSVVPATDSIAGNAASLWTGRWAAHHGVLGNDRALPSGTWTLADAARRSGAATAAILEAPLVSATRIAGFEVVVEEPHLEVAAIADRAKAFLDLAAGRRTLLWVHLRGGADVDGGGADGAEALDDLLGRLSDLYLANGLWPDTATLLVPLSLGEGPDPEPDGAGAAPDPTIPAWIGFPANGWGGRRSDALLALCDLTALLRTSLRVPPPDPLRRESPLQGRAKETQGIARGWDAGLDAFLHREDDALWLRADEVFESPDGPDGEPESLRHWRAGVELETTSDIERDTWWEAYLAREAEARRNAVPAEEARIPRDWRAAESW